MLRRRQQHGMAIGSSREARRRRTSLPFWPSLPLRSALPQRTSLPQRRPLPFTLGRRSPNGHRSPSGRRSTWQLRQWPVEGDDPLHLAGSPCRPPGCSGEHLGLTSLSGRAQGVGCLRLPSALSMGATWIYLSSLQATCSTKCRPRKVPLLLQHTQEEDANLKNHDVNCSQSCPAILQHTQSYLPSYMVHLNDLYHAHEELAMDSSVWAPTMPSESTMSPSHAHHKNKISDLLIYKTPMPLSISILCCLCILTLTLLCLVHLDK